MLSTIHVGTTYTVRSSVTPRMMEKQVRFDRPVGRHHHVGIDARDSWWDRAEKSSAC